MTNTERNLLQNLAVIRGLRPIDDDFMRKIFKDNRNLAQVVLRIILGKDDLFVEDVKTQDDLKKLMGARSIELDVHGWDSEQKQYDIEIQRASSGARPHRARYHLSALDTENLGAGQDFEELPETYVIIITEKDFFHRGKPIYPIERVNLAADYELFNDGEHILYVNGEYEDAAGQVTEIGKLLHDFRCSDPNEMLIPEMQDASRKYKETEEGVREMCEAIEKLREESAREAAREATIKATRETAKQEKEQFAKRMLKAGKPISEVIEFSDLSEERVLELKKEIEAGNV